MAPPTPTTTDTGPPVHGGPVPTRYRNTARTSPRRGRYPSWSRRRVREAVSAVLPASSMALSYAARAC